MSKVFPLFHYFFHGSYIFYLQIYVMDQNNLFIYVHFDHFLPLINY